MPVRDDWTSATKLIQQIDIAVPANTPAIDIILVDDGSLQRCDPLKFPTELAAVNTVKSLRLRRNLGHQRAIAIGLAHTQQSVACDAVVVMDADGEDTPDGFLQLLRLYSESGGDAAIFAARGRRSESLTFRFFYHLYRYLHRSLTGISVRVGNFSILPFEFLGTLVAMSELWNHYAAAVFRSKLPLTMTPIPRGTRIAGASRMDFVALVTHGLSAISVFGDIVGVRLLIGALTGAFLAGSGILALTAIRLFTNAAAPCWALYAAGTLAVLIMQLITVATCFTLFMLSNRTNLGFVPLRDYRLFVEDIVNVYPHE